MGLLAASGGGDFAVACLLLTWPKRGERVRVGVGEGELCGWAAVRNAMVDKHRVTEILIDQPTGRRGRWRGQTGGATTSWIRCNSFCSPLCSFVRRTQFVCKQ